MLKLAYPDYKQDTYLVLESPTEEEIITCIRTRDSLYETTLKLGVESIGGLHIIKGKNITNVSKGHYFRFIVWYRPLGFKGHTLYTLLDANCDEMAEVIRFTLENGETITKKKPFTVDEDVASQVALHFARTGKIVENTTWKPPLSVET